MAYSTYFNHVLNESKAGDAREWLEQNEEGSYQDYLADMQAEGKEYLDSGYFNSVRKKMGIEAPARGSAAAPAAPPRERDEFDDMLDQADEAMGSVEEGGGNSVADRYDKLESMADAAAAGELTALHTIIYGSPGVGKTYTVLERVKDGVERNPTNHKLMVKSGDSGASRSSVAAMLYAYREGWVLVLDDNDSMIDMKNAKGNIANLLKTVLEMNPKTVSIDPEIAKGKNANEKLHMEYDMWDKYNYRNGMPLKRRDKEAPPIPYAFDDDARSLLTTKNTGANVKEGYEIKIDKQALKENIFRYSVNGERFEESISDEEKYEFKRLFETNHRNSWEHRVLHESDDDENEYGTPDIDADDLPDDTGGEYEGDSDLEASFFFSSNVIFISNLTADRIDSAILSRCNKVYLNLSAEEVVDKMDSIFSNLGVKEGAERKLEPQLYDYCRRVVMACIHWCLIAAQRGRAVPDANGVKIRLVNVDGQQQFPTSLQFRLLTAQAAVLYKYMNENAQTLSIPMNPKNFTKILKTFPITGGGRTNYKSSSPLKKIAMDIATELNQKNVDAKRSKA